MTHFLLRYSICWTVRSRKVRSFLTGMTDLGPEQPMLVPGVGFLIVTKINAKLIIQLKITKQSMGWSYLG